jgi:putative tricarboxylic transport membrane protein
VTSAQGRETKRAAIPEGGWPLILETGAWLCLATAAWVLSYQFAGKDMLFRWGADFWPRAVVLLMAGSAIIQFAIRWKALQAHGPKAAATAEGGERSKTQTIKVAATFLIPLLYVFLLPRAGYFLLTPFFIGAMMFLFGLRRPLYLIGMSLLIYVVFLLLFSKLLLVPLPIGYWPGFYDLNTAIANFLQGG